MSTSLKAFVIPLLWTAVLTAPAWGALPPPARPAAAAQPGSINYVEGQASIGTTPVLPGSIGSLVLEKDQILTTQAGKVEILLTPGVFLRVADNSSVKMVSPDLAKTVVELQKGRAFIEVLEIRNQNDIRIEQTDASTKLLKKGLYEFDADHAQVRVFKGEADVYAGEQKIKLTEDREIALNTGGREKARHFDSRMFEDEFYRWNGLRSGYLSEASVSAARAYLGPGPGGYAPGWTGFGWYWDPWFGVYTFLPAEGVYWGPFGWGFYSPFALYYSPYRFYYGYPHAFGDFHYPYGHGFPGPRGFRR